MSRHLIKRKNVTIVYGYDDMMPPPMGGYFFQVFDREKETEENEEGLIVNEGFVMGISRSRMIDLLQEWKVENQEHLTHLALDLPF